MPLTLVLGPANSAKAGEVLTAFTAAARRGAILVVPTATDAELYSRELAAGGALLGSVLTFGGLAGEIARRTGIPHDPLSPLGRRHVLRRAAARLPLEVMAGSAAAPGFALALGDLVAELGRGMVSAPRFAAALRSWSAEDPRREPYARELAGLVRAYAGELSRLGRDDAESAARRALDALRAAPAAWGRTAAFFYGFDDLTALERDAVETLALVAGVEVTVSLTYEPGRGALAARAEVVEALRAIATSVTELPALDEHYAPGSRRALHHLERRLFELGEPERLEAGEAVRVLEAGGERAEAELIAAEVLALRQAGVPAGEILVVARRPQAVAPLLGRVFAALGLRLATRAALPFGHTVLGRSLRAPARCAWAADAGPLDLLALLRAPGRLPDPGPADRLEARLRRSGISDLARALELCDPRPEEIERLRAAAEPAAELVRQARWLFELPHRGRAPLLSGSEDQDAAALRALEAALAELAALGAPLAPAQLLALLDELEVEAEPAERDDSVRLADPLSVRARRFRCVFVCGLQEGTFPAPGRPDPFLSDAARWEIAHAAGLALRPAEDALDRERYLLYASVSRATERLVLSYRSSDEEGQRALPSPFLADVAELFTPDLLAHRRRRLLPDVVWRLEQAPSPRERARTLAAEAGSAGAGPMGPAPAPERRLSEVALALVRHTRVVSPGALELYARCPVRWLVERELAPEPLEPAPEPLSRGDYIHRVLEALLARLDGPLTEARLPAALGLLDEVMAEQPFNAAPGLPEPVRRALVLRVAADLRRYLAFEAATGPGWTPRALELRFGFDEEGGSLPPLALGEGEEAVLVRGTVDRVDVDPTGRQAIVRDYKSGAAQPAHQGSRWAQEGTLQAPLYMLAVREHLGLEPVAGLYQPLSGRDLRPRGIFEQDAGLGEALLPRDGRSADALQEELDGAAARALEVVRRVRAGELEPCPATCSREGCAHPSICRAG